MSFRPEGEIHSATLWRLCRLDRSFLSMLVEMTWPLITLKPNRIPNIISKQGPVYCVNFTELLKCLYKVKTGGPVTISRICYRILIIGVLIAFLPATALPAKLLRARLPVEKEHRREDGPCSGGRHTSRIPYRDDGALDDQGRFTTAISN